MDLTNRQDWLQWRRLGLGASEAAILHNESPYKNRYDLFLEKISEGEIEEKSNAAMQKGQVLEPIIRKRWATIAGMDLNIESEWLPYNVGGDHKIMRASLDGLATDNDGEIVLAEFKYQGKENHLGIAKGIAPRHYWMQVQHQLLVSGAEKGYLVSYNDELDTIYYVEILPDKEFHNEHIRKCKSFWKEVLDKTPSEETLSFKKDIKKNDDSKMQILAKRYVETKKIIDDTEKILEELKKELIAANGVADKTDFEFVTVTKAIRSGSVEYKEIPELKGVDLEKYRKPSTEYFLVKVK